MVVLYRPEFVRDAERMHFNVRFIGKTISKDEAKCFKIDAKIFQRQAK